MSVFFEDRIVRLILSHKMPVMLLGISEPVFGVSASGAIEAVGLDAQGRSRAADGDAKEIHG
jgi:hypothetical protein